MLGGEPSPVRQLVVYESDCGTYTNRVISSPMTLVEFIEQEGDARAAKLFRVKPRTAKSWRLGDRTPRPKQARIIVEKSPVTMQEIYGKAA